MELIVNQCYGGFSLSVFGWAKLFERKNKPIFFYRDSKNGYERIDDYEDASDLFYAVNKDLGKYLTSVKGWNDINKNGCYISAQNFRRDTDLIEIIKEYGGGKVSGCHSYLVVKTIPDNTSYEITEYNGYEYCKVNDAD